MPLVFRIPLTFRSSIFPGEDEKERQNEISKNRAEEGQSGYAGGEGDRDIIYQKNIGE
jgi:hypothetical protein